MRGTAAAAGRAAPGSVSAARGNPSRPRRRAPGGSWRASPGRAALAAAAAAVAVLWADGLRAQDVERGRELYRRWCVECHGEDGKGQGPAAARMLPRPRDFTGARYQVRTTGSGELPTDENLHRVIRDGVPGTTMPGWPDLSRSERSDVIAYLKSLSPFFGRGEPPEPVELGEDPGGGEEAVEAGRQVYRELECYRCHGQAGRGDGTSAPTLEDWRGNPVRAADLTRPWDFNGGGSVEAVHARFLTGLDGTPMPTQADALRSEIVDHEDLWNLAHYVRSLGPERSPPRIRDAVRVVRAEGELPAGPASDAWSGIPEFYFPMAGQVIERPRQFEPMVRGVRVQGVHDGEELVLRVSWNDPSSSPDSAWDEWTEKMADRMFDDGTPIPTAPLPDRLALQFPTEIPTGRERPYFLMGDGQNPVYLWRWDSGDGHREATATGLGTASPLEETRLAGEAVWEEGRWRATFRRSLEAEGRRVPFRPGVPVPVAFFAWDGDSGEDATRGSVTSWYFLVLEEPAGDSIYVAPLVAVLLTGGLGFFMSRRARRRDGPGPAAGDAGGDPRGGG